MSRLPHPLTPAIRRVTLGFLSLFVATGVVFSAGDRDQPVDIGTTPAAPVTAPAAAPSAFADRRFETSATLRTEARTLVELLEQVNYNRDAVRASSYDEIINDFMGELDGQRLFFLGSDKANFTSQFGKSLYWNVKNLGNIDASYKMFAVYLTRTEDRANWIFNELKKDMDLRTNEFYPFDRTKAEWPADAAAADDLWRKRLKNDVISEILNAKNPAATADGVKTKPVITSEEIQNGKTAAEVKSPKDAAAIVASADQKTIEDAKTAVRKRYERMLKNVGEIENSDVSEMFLSTIARLYDPHSSYFSAESYEDFGIQMKLRLVGIGAMLSVEDDYCVVKELVPGGPADLSKQLHPNDKIIAVAQPGAEPVDVIGMKLRKIVEMIRGNQDTQVHLILQPADAPDPTTRKEIVLTRDVVKIQSNRAHGAIFEVPDADGKTVPYGVLTLPGFYNSNDSDEGEAYTASKDVAALLARFQQANVKGVVLDLRHNGGGLLSEAIDLAGLFINKGPVVQVKDYQNHITIDSDENSGIAYSGPLAVLVDRFSASASEIVAGALQNYGRAIVIGDSSTHGKGTVQELREMREFIQQFARSPVKTGAAKLTIQKFYLPNGSSTQLKGVVPDIVLPSIDDYIPQLGEAKLDHALAWDEIPSSVFDGKPLDAKVLTPLREASHQRQASLEEFSYLKKNIDWFKTRQEQNLVSLNLDVRRKQKDEDDAFRKEMKTERDRLNKNDYAYEEVRLGPPPPPKIKATKKADDQNPGVDPDDDELSTDENEDYVKGDIDLREALRVLTDAVSLAKNPDFLASGTAPLTAQASKKG